MNINNLEKDMIIKNYKELCDVLQEDIKGGSSKRAQLKELKRYCKYKKEGNKFIIQEIYKTQKQKIDNRYGNHSNRINYKAFKPSEIDGDKTGVYCIIKDNNIYIGSTIRSFRDRFQEHNMSSRIDNEKTYKMLHNNGCFDILWIANKNVTEQQIREKEYSYINKFKNNKNWNVINCIGNPYYKTIKIKVKATEYAKTIKILKEYNII